MIPNKRADSNSEGRTITSISPASSATTRFSSIMYQAINTDTKEEMLSKDKCINQIVVGFSYLGYKLTYPKQLKKCIVALKIQCKD